jgi:hypothetical protein
MKRVFIFDIQVISYYSSSFCIVSVLSWSCNKRISSWAWNIINTCIVSIIIVVVILTGRRRIIIRNSIIITSFDNIWLVFLRIIIRDVIDSICGIIWWRTCVCIRVCIINMLFYASRRLRLSFYLSWWTIIVRAIA